MSDYEKRFGGIARLYGREALERLRNAHIAVVGIGGVGSWTVESLARSGVGRLTLVDLDDICITNTNRQIHSTHDTVGQLKVESMQQRARAINPEVNVDFLRGSIGNSEVMKPVSSGTTMTLCEVCRNR